MLAVALAWAWVRALDRPMTLRRAPWGSEHYEGDDVPVNLELAREGRWTPSTLPLVDFVKGFARVDVLVHRTGRGTAPGPVRPPGRPARPLPVRGLGRRARGPLRARAARGAPAGGGRAARLPAPVDARVGLPRVGRARAGGPPAAAAAPTGFDIHSVRDYERGESLRKVHWKSTARRGKLMVKELEDAPRDETAVLLDASAGNVAGTPPDSSFDMQVRAAGSILAAHARRGRRAVLVVNSAAREHQQVRAEDADWHRALELLAAAEPTGETPASTLLSEETSPASRALEVTVVTAHLTPALVDRLVQRSLNRRGVAVVYVDAPTFAGGAETVEPGLLRLQAAGVPVAVLRRGDDLGAQLGGRVLAGAASG